MKKDVDKYIYYRTRVIEMDWKESQLEKQKKSWKKENTELCMDNKTDKVVYYGVLHWSSDQS